jgi:hypothetical protein
MKNLLLILTILAASSAFAAPKKGDGNGPCKQIADACQKAGFIPGDWKKGDGLWRDCVDPIIQGVSTVPGGSKPLPTVDASLIAACKAKRPNFGKGAVGSVQPAGKGGATSNNSNTKQ